GLRPTFFSGFYFLATRVQKIERQQRNDHRRAGQSRLAPHKLQMMGGTYLSQTDYTNPKRQRGNVLTPSLALRVSVTTGAGVVREPAIFPAISLRTPG